MFSKLTTVALFLSTASATWTPNMMCDPGVQGGTDPETKDLPKPVMKNLNEADPASAGKFLGVTDASCMTQCKEYSKTNTPKSETVPVAIDLTKKAICCQYVRASAADKTGDDIDGSCNAYDVSGDVVNVTTQKVTKVDGQADVSEDVVTSTPNLYAYSGLHQHTDNASFVAFVTAGEILTETIQARPFAGTLPTKNVSKCSDRDVTNCKKGGEQCKSTATPDLNMACTPGTRCAIPATDERTGAGEKDFMTDKGVEICISFTSCSQSLMRPGGLVGAACTAEIKKTNPTCEGPLKFKLAEAACTAEVKKTNPTCVGEAVIWTCGSTKLIASLAAVLAISSAL